MSELQRGNLLWESSRMFLPEHKEMLRERRSRKREFEPPELAEDQLNAIDEALARAAGEDAVVAIVYADRYGESRVTGRIVRVDPAGRRLTVSGRSGVRTLDFAKVLRVEREPG